MTDLRLRFEKTGRAVYISHLDLMRTFQRAFLRAGMPLSYSEGYNPHAKISIALPLSVGVESYCELIDFSLRDKLTLAEIPRRLNAVLPEGVKAQEAYRFERKAKHIKWLDVSGVYEYDVGNAAEILPALVEFYGQESLVIERKTKSGIGEADIAPSIRGITFDDAYGGAVRFRALISAQEPTLNPEHLVAALRQLAPEISPDFARFTRMQVFDADMQVFM